MNNPFKGLFRSKQPKRLVHIVGAFNETIGDLNTLHEHNHKTIAGNSATISSLTAHSAELSDEATKALRVKSNLEALLK